jgi:hypothetical protein
MFPIDWNKLESSLINSEYDLVRKYFDTCTSDVHVTGIIFEKDEWADILSLVIGNDNGILLFEGICNLFSFTVRCEFLRNFSDMCEMADDCNLSDDDTHDLFDSGKFTEFVRKYEACGCPYFCQDENDFWENSEHYDDALTEYMDLESYMSDNMDWKRTIQTNSGYWIF